MSRLTLAARLDQHLRAQSLAIVGVSIADEADRATWQVQPASLQASAQPFIDAFVVPTVAQIADEDAQREVTERKLRAVAMALWECIPAPTMTKAQLQARAIAIYKTLT